MYRFQHEELLHHVAYIKVHEVSFNNFAANTHLSGHLLYFCGELLKISSQMASCHEVDPSQCNHVPLFICKNSGFNLRIISNSDSADQ